MMNRRSTLLAALSPLLLAAGRAAAANAADAQPVKVLGRQSIVTAWRVADGSAAGSTTPDSGQHVGVLDVDWDAGRVQLASLHPVPTRAHGLLALADGGYVAVANRPGRWLLRCDADGAITRQLDTRSEAPSRTLNGHAEASADGRWLFTTETDTTTGAGWVSVRDARTLARVAQFSSGGIDAHQLLLAADGALLVANGGIVRDPLGRKVSGERMAPSLVQLRPASGELQGRWTLPDTQISLRHMAWSTGPQPLLGIALQAEHADLALRAAAPLLAVWDGHRLQLPSTDTSGRGYAGDISAGPGGGFVLSAQKQGRALWWHPGQSDRLTTVAELTEPCALLALPDGAGVALSAGRGLARWHTAQGPRMLPWPVRLAPDNHWASLVRV